MPKHIVRLVLLTAVFVATALPAWAQRTDGPTPTFRRGAEWQHGIDKAEEAEKRLHLKIDSWNHDEWIRNALAWIHYDLRERSVVIDRSDRVADVAAGKKAEVATTGDDDTPAWQIAFAKKPPRSLTLILTDQGRTQVNCPFKESPKDGGGLWGVFQDPETTLLHCFWRAAPERTASIEGP